MCIIMNLYCNLLVIKNKIPSKAIAKVSLDICNSQKFSSSTTNFQHLSKHVEEAPKPKSASRILFFGSDDFSAKVFSHLHKDNLIKTSSQYHFDICTKLPIVKSYAINNPALSSSVNQGLIESKNLTSFYHDLTLAGHPLLHYISGNGPTININPWPPNLYYDLDGNLSPKPFKEGSSTYELGVIASFGSMIPRLTIEAFKYGIICIHPSLLPRWRGPCPIHHTLLSADPFAGVTIFKITPDHFDRGPILARHPTPVKPRDTYVTLVDQLASLGAQLFLDRILSNFPQSVKDGASIDQNSELAQNLLQPIPFTEDHDKLVQELDDTTARGWMAQVRSNGPSVASHAPKRDWLADLRVSWSTQTRDQLSHLYRALGERYGGLRTTLRGEPLRLLDPVSGGQAEDDAILDRYYVRYGYLKPIAQATGNKKKQLITAGRTGATTGDAIPFGTAFYSYRHHTIFVTCASGDGKRPRSWMGFKKVVYGGKRMSARDFYNGYLTKPQYAGAILV